MTTQRLTRNRQELADFLKNKRQSITPAQVGLPESTRRRTKGLRREEVAALSGVGVTWYTWLEQGRDIGVSASFLDNLSKLFRLNAAERRHLYLLAHARLPSEPGKTWCNITPIIRRIMDSLSPHLVYVLNLRWDVLAFNQAADDYFNFSQHSDENRNFLWLLFTSQHWRECLPNWSLDAKRMLASFRRDYATSDQAADFQALIYQLEKASPDFNYFWHKHEIYEPCTGIRQLAKEKINQNFEYASLVVDSDNNIRMIVYAEQN